MWKVGDGPLICDNSVPESLAGITEDLPSINPSDKGSEESLVLEFGKTESFDGNLDLVGSGEKREGSSHGSVTARVLGVTNVTNVEIPGTWGSTDSTANQDLASRSDLEVVLQSLRVVVDGVNPAFTFVEREGNVLEENRTSSAMSPAATPRAPTPSASSFPMIHNSPPASICLTFSTSLPSFPWRKWWDATVLGSSSGVAEGGVKFLALTTLWPVGKCWTKI